MVIPTVQNAVSVPVSVPVVPASTPITTPAAATPASNSVMANSDNPAKPAPEATPIISAVTPAVGGVVTSQNDAVPQQAPTASVQGGQGGAGTGNSGYGGHRHNHQRDENYGHGGFTASYHKSSMESLPGGKDMQR